MSMVTNDEIRIIQIRLNNRPKNDWDLKHQHSCFINPSSALRFELESIF
jgi:hypothetical protein